MANTEKRTVVVDFEGNPEKLIGAYKQLETELGKVQSELEKVKKKQADLEAQSDKNKKAFSSSLGSMADGLGKLIPGFDQIAGGFKKAESAAKSFGTGTKSALLATGIGAVIILVTELISTFSNLKEKAPEDLSIVEKAFVDLGDAITGTGESALSWTTIILQGVSPALGQMSAAHDLANKKIKDEKKAWDDAIIALKERARQQQDFEERVKKGEESRQKRIDQTNKEAEALRNAAAAERERTEAAEKAMMIQAAKDYAFLAAMDAQTRAQNSLAGATNVTSEAVKGLQVVKTDEVKAAEASYNAMVKRAQTELDIQNTMNDAFLQTAIGQKFNDAKGAFKDGKAGIMKVWKGEAPFIVKLAQSAFLAGVTLKNIKDIVGVQFNSLPQFKLEEGGTLPTNGGMIRGRRHYQGGVKFRVGGYAAEAEGGEYIVNRKATAKYLPQLQAINNSVKFADGGFVAAQAEFSRIQATIREASMSQRSVLVLEDLRRASNRLDVVEQLARS